MAKAGGHPATMVESKISHGELLGVVSKESLYRMRQIDVKNVDTIYQHLAENRESHGGKGGQPVTSETFELSVDVK